MKNIFLLAAHFGVISMYGAMVRPPIERLNAPSLEHAKPFFCDRPKSSVGPIIRCEELSGKLVVDCYGHGGSGFTTLFGSVQHALTLLLQKNPDRTSPVCVIGSGCMGLLMALELRACNFTDVKIVTKPGYDMPSWRAGGFFDPGTGKEVDEQSKFILQLGLDTYNVLRTIERGEHPYIQSSVVQKMPLYSLDTVSPGVEVLAELGYMPKATPVTLAFESGKEHRDYVKHWTYFINVTDLMQQLWAQVKALGIPVVYEEVKKIDDRSESLVCNCTGLGANSLVENPSLYPVRGHFFMAGADGKERNYMFLTKVDQGAGKAYLMFFPKSKLVSSDDQEGGAYCGMVGGTFIPHVNKMSAEEVARVDDEQLCLLKQRACEFFGEKV